MTNSINPNGPTYLVIQGIFDSLCAGILLYVGFTLLLADFHRDAETHCKGKPYEGLLRAGMFAGFWGGAGAMAYIGKYL